MLCLVINKYILQKKTIITFEIAHQLPNVKLSFLGFNLIPSLISSISSSSFLLSLCVYIFILFVFISISLCLFLLSLCVYFFILSVFISSISLSLFPAFISSSFVFSFALKRVMRHQSTSAWKFFRSRKNVKNNFKLDKTLPEKSFN